MKPGVASNINQHTRYSSLLKYYRQRHTLLLAELWGIAGVLAVVLLFSYRLIGPSVSVPGDIAAVIPPWNTTVTQPIYNPALSDVLVSVYPNRIFINSALQRGEFPLWNTYILSGHPVAADPNIALFYPTTIALGWLSAGNALDLHILLHLTIACFGMYALVRVWQGSRIGGIAAAAIFVGSSALTVWQQYSNLLAAAAWLPWLIVCFERAHHSGRLRWVGLGGLVLGLMFLANFIQWTLYGLFFLACYALFLSIPKLMQRQWRSGITPLINGTAIVGIGLMVGAIQLIPFIELSALSKRTEPFSYAALQAATLPSIKLLTALIPNFFGTPTLANSGWGPSNYAESTLYWGFLPTILALTTPLWRRDKKAWFTWGMLLLGLSILLGLPTLYVFKLLPGFNVLAHNRLIFLVCFCGALLTGLVFQHIVQVGQRWRSLLIISIGILSARLFIHWAIIYFRSRLPQQHTALLNDTRWMTMMMGGILVCLLIPYVPARFARYLPAFGLLLIIVADIARFSLPYNRFTMNEQQILPQSPILSELAQATDQRFVAVNNQTTSLLPNSLLALGIHEVGGYNSLVLQSYREFLRLIDGTDDTLSGTNMVVLNNPQPSLVDLFGAEYVISTQPIVPAPAKLTLLKQGGGMWVYRNTQAAPRAIIVGTIQPVANREAAWQALANPAFRPCDFATVEMPSLPLAQVQPGCVGTATITAYTANRVTLTTNAIRDGFLVLSDVYYRGWRVTVDGAEQPVYPANGIFRGTPIKAGEHSVEFVFRPPSVFVGGAISLIGCIISVLLSVIGHKRRASAIQVEGLAS